MLEYESWATLSMQQAEHGGSLPATDTAQAKFSAELLSARDRALHAAASLAQLDLSGLVSTSRRLLDKSPAYLLDLVDVIEQARTGSISIKLNAKNAATRKRTAHLPLITTREQGQAHLVKLQRQRVALALSPDYLKKRVWYIKWWVRYCLTFWGEQPWLVGTLFELYEAMLSGFHGLVTERYGPCGAGAQAVTHVVQWHLTVLRIALPAFPLLANDKRLESRRARKHAKSVEKTARRGYTRVQVQEACSDLQQIAAGRPVLIGDAIPSFGIRLEAAVMRLTLAACWWLILRLIEMCRGGEYDPDLHWSREWLIEAGWLRVKLGGAAITAQMQRKQDGNAQNHAFSFEKLPVLYLDLPHNPQSPPSATSWPSTRSRTRASTSRPTASRHRGCHPPNTQPASS